MKSRILIIALTATLLSGCGFHLRNALNLPANLGPVRVLAADRYSPLSEMLADGLQRAGAQAGVAPACGDGRIGVRGGRTGAPPPDRAGCLCLGV